MARKIIPYPCEIKVGDFMLTKDQREREIVEIDGRYIHFKDGSLFAFSHPDLVGVIVKTKKRAKETEEE